MMIYADTHAEALKVGARLKELRRYRCMTQSALAGEQLTRNMLSQIERGASLPSYATIVYLSEKLSVDPSYFFDGGPTIDDVAEREQLLFASAHFSSGNYALCLMDAEPLRSVKDLQFLQILGHACYYLGVEAFTDGRLAESDCFFARSLNYIAATPFSAFFEVRIRFMRMMIEQIRAPKLLNIPSLFAGIPDDPLYSDELQYVFLNALIDHGQIDDAVRLYALTSIKNPFFRSHFNARIAASMNNYDRAKTLIKEVVDDPSGIPFPFVYKAYDDLERYCKATDDYEGAYRCTLEKQRFRYS